MDLSHWLLFALIMGLGLVTGAVIFEARVVVPLWFEDVPESIVDFHNPPMRVNSGGRFWIAVTPLVGIIAGTNAYFAYNSLSVNDAREWWLFSSALASGTIVITFLYFIPILISLSTAAQMHQRKLVRRVKIWRALNWLRSLSFVVAWLAAVQALYLGAVK